jgi:hypothetical protein
MFRFWRSGVTAEGQDESIMEQTRIKVRFADTAGVAELQVITAPHSDVGSRIRDALTSVEVVPLSEYEVETGGRVIAHAKLTEGDGSPLQKSRGKEVLRALRCHLAVPNTSPLSFLPTTRPANSQERSPHHPTARSA